MLAQRQLRSERAREAHRRRKERAEQAKKDREERLYWIKEAEKLRALHRAEKEAELTTMKAATDQAASGPAPRENTPDRASSGPSDMADSTIQECNPVDNPKMTHQSAQKRPVSPTATEREITPIKRQAKVTNDNASSSTTTASAIDENRRTTQNVAFRTTIPATVEISNTCSCAPELKRLVEEINSLDQEVTEGLEVVEDINRRVDFHLNGIRLLSEALNGKQPCQENGQDA